MIVIFDRQHFGKPGKSDTGAASDLDGDGVTETQEQEANLTPLYYGAAKTMLEAMGHQVVVLDSGWYPARHERANQIARNNLSQKVAYLACHINAGKGDYSVMIHDERSQNGKRLADCLARSLERQNLPGLKRHLTRSATATNEWRRGFSMIQGIYAGPPNIAGVCVEPYFIDRPEHAWAGTVSGSKIIGESLVVGILAWGL